MFVIDNARNSSFFLFVEFILSLNLPFPSSDFQLICVDTRNIVGWRQHNFGVNQGATTS